MDESGKLPALTPADTLALERERLELEREKLKLDRHKNQLDYRKFVLGSVFVALAIAAIPPLFQLATAVLEHTKATAERQAKQQEFRDQYIKEFISNALNQDVELRIRFAQYFARVSTEPARQDWITYLGDLRAKRSEIRDGIDKMEAELSVLSSAKSRDDVQIAKLIRNLDWAYAEVGYVARNRSAAGNPRVAEDARVSYAPAVGGGMSMRVGRFSDATYYLLDKLAFDPGLASGKKSDPITIPAGFVFSLDSIPKAYWSLIRPDGNISLAALLHDYLYWTQSRPRNEADDLFKQMLLTTGVELRTVTALYTGTRVGGQVVWDDYAKRKAAGEKRVMKMFPTDPNITWDEWRKRPEVFAGTQ